MRFAGIALVLGLAVGIAGCGGGGGSAASSNSVFTITPSTASIDTNGSVTFNAYLTGTSTAANVTWSLSGGDPYAGYGTVSTSTGSTMVYTPPSVLTTNSASVTVTATYSNGTVTAPIATTRITITPGFLQPLTPENASAGAGATVAFTGYLAEVGGSDGISFALSSTSTGSSGGAGSLGNTSCTRDPVTSSDGGNYTYCTVTYTAPSTISGNAPTYLVATVSGTSSKINAPILLNTAGVTVSPAINQAVQSGAVYLGTSGGANLDYDTQYYQGSYYITDCCGGTLGSLVQDQNGSKYILSNNHVLARSDQASIGSSIVQPGLIDDGCVPYGTSGSTVTPVASLTGYVPIYLPASNVDAGVAAIYSGYVDPSGNILELGLPSGGKLAAGAPAAGTGEAPSIGLTVAKSGRTTGLTCSSITSTSMSVAIDYYYDCAETNLYQPKTYTNQVVVQGYNFSDAGDSGSLIVDTTNAQPVALLFAGGTDGSGNSITIANPVSEVLSELGSTTLAPTSTAMAAITGKTFSFVGGATHAVSCLNYDSGTFTAAGQRTVALSSAQLTLRSSAVSAAQSIVNARNGILAVAAGKSFDHPGEAAVIVYVDRNAANISVPATIKGVRTVVIPTSSAEIAGGTASTTPQSGTSLSSATLSKAIALKEQSEKSLLAGKNYFGVGVTQSFDNPNEAALLILVDKNNVPASLPTTINGLRTRYIVMERLHVSRSYGTNAHPSRCTVKNALHHEQQPAWKPAEERIAFK